METLNQKKSKRRDRTSKFKPTHSFIQSAVEEYICNGGKITKLEPEQAPILESGFDWEADEFLAGN